MEVFVRRAERQTKESINRSYRDIDMLYWELDFLNDLFHRYSIRKSGHTLTSGQRHKEMAEIRERIPVIHEYIKYYKDCINAEKKEMQRIYNTYGFEPKQKQIFQEYEGEELEYQDEYYDGPETEEYQQESEEEDEQK
jgi:hypothetical protein